MTGQPGTATSRVMIENSRLRVTEWQFARRGDNTGWHTHHHDYVVVPLFDGALDIHSGGDQVTRFATTTGEAYFRKAGVSHDVLSANDFPCKFLEIELLERAH